MKINDISKLRRLIERLVEEHDVDDDVREAGELVKGYLDDVLLECENANEDDYDELELNNEEELDDDE